MNRYLILLTIVFLFSFSPSQSKERPLGNVAIIEIPEDWDSISKGWIDFYNSAKGDSSLIYIGGFFPTENTGPPSTLPILSIILNLIEDCGMI